MKELLPIIHSKETTTITDFHHFSAFKQIRDAMVKKLTTGVAPLAGKEPKSLEKKIFLTVSSMVTSPQFPEDPFYK